MHTDIAERVVRLNDDFERVQGYRFSHFYCPILHEDENTPLCRGHIIPASTGRSNIWVPQRKDVDNDLGSKLEAHLNRLDVRFRPIKDFFLDKDLYRHFRPQIVLGEQVLAHYPTNERNPKPGQTPLMMDFDEQVCNFNLKIDPEAMMKENPKSLEIRVDYDLSAHVCAAAIKAAHLTLFKVLGYTYVFSSAGLFLASLLKPLFEAIKNGRFDVELQRWMQQTSGAVRPMVGEGFEQPPCSLIDNRYFVCQRSTKGYFALCVNVSFGIDTFSVFVPSGDGTIDTYMSFLQSPANAVHVRECSFREYDKHWDVCGGGEPLRMPIYLDEFPPPSHPSTPAPPPPAA